MEGLICEQVGNRVDMYFRFVRNRVHMYKRVDINECRGG